MSEGRDLSTGLPFRCAFMFLQVDGRLTRWIDTTVTRLQPSVGCSIVEVLKSEWRVRTSVWMLVLVGVSIHIDSFFLAQLVFE